MKHLFVICAYQENPYLEKCVQSIVNQTFKSNILISTSTPNEYIKNIASKYHLPMIVNTGIGDASDNLNFAYANAQADFVTLCHQDDYYAPKYLEYIIKEIEKAKSPVILFTDYYEDREDEIVKNNTLLRIKRTMLLPLKNRVLRKSVLVRKFVLGLGNPICCPSVTFNRQLIAELGYKREYLAVGDWQIWIRLATLKGEFCYIAKPLMYHRIHEGSTTSVTIESSLRSQQEMELFCTIWPKWFARILAKLYAKGQKSNYVE